MCRKYYLVVPIISVLALVNAGVLFYLSATDAWFSQQWERFQLTYPAGTYVIDQIQKQIYQIQENGKSRPLAIHEIAQLDTMHQFARANQGGLSTWQLVLVLVLTVIGFVYLKRRLSPEKHHSADSQSSEVS